MKKRLAMLMALCMLAGLTACSSKPDSTGSEPAETAPQQVESEKAEADVTDTPADTETAEGDASEADTPEAVEATVTVLKPDEAMDYKGKELSFTIANPDDNGSGNMVVSYGDKSYEVEEYAEWLTDSYIVDIDDTSFYLLLQPCYSNDWRNTWLLKYDGNDFVELGSRNGGIDGVESIANGQVVLSSRIDIFGTYGIYINYKYGDDGLVEVPSEDGILHFINEADPEIWASYNEEEMDPESMEYVKSIWDEEGYRILTLKQDLKAYEDGNETVINAGERIRVYGVNGEEHRFYFTIGGKLMYFIYEDTDDFTLTIDGLDQGELFVNLPYAG